MRLIDADALIQKRCHAKDFFSQPEIYVIGHGYVMDAPTIETTREARWKGAGFGDYTCSLCSETISGKTNFCPSCGADMGMEDKN